MSELQDTYLTIAEPASGLYREKGSKFLAFAHEVANETEIKTVQQDYRKKYHDARHHCYAWRLGHEMKHYRANDDGEPNNSAGKPILGQIQSHNLTNVLIVVVRYFGGTKLGVGGLIHAYRAAAADALEQVKFVTRVVTLDYTIRFGYDRMSDVMRIVKDYGIEQLNQQFDLSCALDIRVRMKDADQVVELLEKLEGVKAAPISY